MKRWSVLSSLLIRRRAPLSAIPGRIFSSRADSNERDGSTDIELVPTAHESSGDGAPSLPHGFSVFRRPGSGRFMLEKHLDSPPNELPSKEDTSTLSRTLLVLCDATSGRSWSKKVTEGAKEAPRLARVRSTRADPDLPLFFTCVVLDPGVHLTMEVRCSAFDESITIDGLSFHRDDGQALISKPTPANFSALASFYTGPRLHQRHLAEVVAQADTSHSLLPITNDPHSLQSLEYSLYHGNPHLNRFTHYGHHPVHTIEPPLYNRLVPYLETLGINEALGAFLRRYGAWLQRTERKRWSADVLAALGRKKNP
jgi:hypothetical protein